MSAGEKYDDDRSSATYYFSEDIVINILQWLPTLSCIGRFRCVCRSWRNLLSDPNVIRKIIFHKSSDDQKKFKVLISGRRYGPRFLSVVFSIYSYETLRPIEELVTPVELDSRVIGCCDGIFCLAHTTRDDDNGNYHHSTVLWNPATSEIKIIPPGPYHPCHSSRIFLYLRAERIGFGYDPKTDDYKVIRVMEFEESTTEDDDKYEYDYDPAQFYHGPTPLIFTEVYSLKNDSWKTLNVATHSAVDKYIYDSLAHDIENLNQQWDNSRNQKCYWFRREESPGICAVISFDMSTEMFELVTFPHPTGLTHHEEDIVVCNSSFGEHGDDWYVRSHFMLKGVIMVNFSTSCMKCSNIPNDEIWVLLKYGVAESWTKLVSWPQPNRIYHPEVWKDDAYICLANGNMSVRDIITGEVIYEHIEIEGTAAFEARIFTPTQVSMSRLVLEQ